MVKNILSPSLATHCRFAGFSIDPALFSQHGNIEMAGGCENELWYPNFCYQAVKNEIVFQILILGPCLGLTDTCV